MYNDVLIHKQIAWNMNDIVGGQKMMMLGSLMPSDDSANVAYAKVYVTDISGDIDDALWVDTINMTA